MKAKLPSQPSGGLHAAQPRGVGPICGGPSPTPAWPLILCVTLGLAQPDTGCRLELCRETEAQRGGDQPGVTPEVSGRSLLRGLVARP